MKQAICYIFIVLLITSCEPQSQKTHNNTNSNESELISSFDTIDEVIIITNRAKVGLKVVDSIFASAADLDKVKDLIEPLRNIPLTESRLRQLQVANMTMSDVSNLLASSLSLDEHIENAMIIANVCRDFEVGYYYLSNIYEQSKSNGPGASFLMGSAWVQFCMGHQYFSKGKQLSSQITQEVDCQPSWLVAILHDAVMCQVLDGDLDYAVISSEELMKTTFENNSEISPGMISSAVNLRLYVLSKQERLLEAADLIKCINKQYPDVAATIDKFYLSVLDNKKPVLIPYAWPSIQ